MKNTSLLDQFRSFYIRNYPNDMETHIEYFAIFGGLGFEVDTTQPISFLIEDLILENFTYLNAKMEDLTLGSPINKRLLHALAVGDRRIFSAFNRAGLNNGNGGAALNYLQERGLVQIEYSREESNKSPNQKHKLKRELARQRISHKVLFTHPFIRFWFYFIYPNIRDIRNKKYERLFKSLEQRQNSYTSLVFEELSEVLLNYNLRDAQIISSGSYWDAKIEIDILTITDNDKIYVAECKWTNHVVIKKEWHKLMQKCEKLGIEPSQIILFSKRGFSKELKQMQGKKLALYSSDDFEVLLKNTSSDELIDSLF
ncbi:MAG: DUF234 domain-containing protein [Sulfurimonas sp.]|uniref:DUF234 domain-containing protein n=1 Tax=Sulfurimonas sp. TaxID=2022749 RepID=UPI0025EBAC18|nr:DUF234 domain-containing protein [Sulfurimonas sp.]MCK9492620.1 DUF234 domain-containing protein [Sulfurimonas sp.]